eukprot:g59467.t1
MCLVNSNILLNPSKYINYGTAFAFKFFSLCHFVQRHVLSQTRKVTTRDELVRVPGSKILRWDTPKFHSSRVCLHTTRRLNAEEPIILKSVAATVKSEISERIRQLPSHVDKPCLAVILVGSRKDSETYVRSKKQACKAVGFARQWACKAVGMQSVERNFPDTASQEEVLEAVRALNKDSKVHGILVQLPLPKHMQPREILEAIHPHKDVDGLTMANHGDLFAHGGDAKLIPCTPQGCMRLLKEAKIPIKGKHAVVLGRSNLVGKPIAMLLQSEHATVTMCHSRTRDLPKIVQQADIVVAALGIPEYVKKEWLKPGAVVLDVGINSVTDASHPRGYRLVGDVDFDACKQVASAITPVPGGVGPMTVAMLLQNTLNAWELQQRRPERTTYITQVQVARTVLALGWKRKPADSLSFHRSDIVLIASVYYKSNLKGLLTRSLFLIISHLLLRLIPHQGLLP